uniref:Uncharacterized protein n=1 Tax=Glossina brevipalpis TaxID=37001 RepID=A0A1A9X059_9MUSC
MKLWERKLIIVIISALLGFSLIISFCLLPMVQENGLVFKRPQMGSSKNFINSEVAKFHIGQRGQYWILYKYIAALNIYTGNESVSLALHGEYTDLIILNALIRRWHGPISLTLFVNGDDFHQAQNIILYLIKCTEFSIKIRWFVTFNFIMHEDHIWRHIPKSEKDFMSRTVDCINSPFSSHNETYRQQKKLPYPSNMARNVARQTVSTYYVLSLDLNYLPSAKFIENFLEMVHKLYLDNPLNTLYCLTVFNASIKTVLPETKTDLLLYYKKYKKLYLTEESWRIPYLRSWLTSSNKADGFSILTTLKHEGLWFPWYVSANQYEPFADERFYEESFIDRWSHFDLLQALDYNFAVIDNAFLLHRSLSNTSINHDIDMRKAMNATDVNYHRKLITMKNLLMNFM